PKGASSIAYKLNATNKADAHTWKIALIGGANVKGATAYVSTQLAELEVAPAYLTGKMELTKVERGQTAKMTCTLEQKIPFDGSATARLMGLPDTVTATDVEITKDSKEVVFTIQTTDKSPTGSFKNVFCNVTIPRAAEAISQNIASGSMLRIDPPRAKPVATAAAATGKAQEALAK